ncbi:DUF2232 domain-containing protein [Vallitalea guaymasensis]|uniref:DUF2232 domain-containing protein n=1 Tax=Vallitalea guaymasensis TaxID=1185412 RepID=A0A8J8SC87_9FIRM|nr:DUF2232 domain-containing protein [Vallitalea guaymasensis]QUH29482.1 DUF2232 domain-containing protein [Vallitalea guaymasensis]
MKKSSNARYILLLIILIVNALYSYLFLTRGEVIFLSFIVFIPIAIYSLQYEVDSRLICCMLAVSIGIYMLYGIEDFILYSMLIILPAFIISYIVKEEIAFSKALSFTSLLMFVCFLCAIISLKYICKIDVIEGYFNIIDALEIEFTNVYSGFFKANTNSIQEYSIAMGTFKNTFHFMKYYYPALLYLLCLGISFISILCIRVIAIKAKLYDHGLGNILGLKVSRSMIVFLLITICTKAFNLSSNSYFLIAINNILVILTVMLFLLGILFEVSVIKRVRSAGRRSLLILVSIFCLVFFQAYFVVAGFIDSVFQIRVKLNNA